MPIVKYPFSLIIIFMMLVSSCSQSGDTLTTDSSPEKMVASTTKQAASPHPYGGWYCPDNLRGFPPVDIADLDQVPVVTDRLPTQEETRNGTSLIYIDPIRYPGAYPLSMELPRLARYYSESTKKNELIIVIQAVDVNRDSIVGFRYVNGGNGSARLHEVTFLSELESQNIKSTPFVSKEISINAGPSTVFDVITNRKYANKLGAAFAEGAYVESDWKDKSAVHVKYGPGVSMKAGHITAIWEDMYIQIDYDFDGEHYVEKFFMYSDKEQPTITNLQLVAGPYASDYPVHQKIWNKWIQTLKSISESAEL